MLHVQNVSHGFGERQILDNATFRMKKGEHIGLIGANGAGKTTIFNLLTSVYQPTRGSILLKGIDTKGMSTAKIKAAAKPSFCRKDA